MRPRNLPLPLATMVLMALVLTAPAFGCSSDGGGGNDRDADGAREVPTSSAADTRSALVHEIASPAANGAGMPNMSVAPDGRVLMSWLEPVDAADESATSTRSGRFALRFAALADESWSQPRTIAEGDDFFVNWADFPMIIESGGVLAAHWLRMNGGRGTSYDIQLARSRDGGESWEEPVVPHADGTPTEHGFVSLIPEADGGFTAVWLDGRKFAAPKPGAVAEMTLRAARFDAEGNEGTEQLLDPRICDCCQTSAAFIGETLVVLYRDRSEDEVRDIWSVRRDEEGWHDPVRVARDNWQIPGCPVNGPAIAANGDGGVAAWFSLRDGDPEVKVAFTRDAGASFAEPTLLDHGRAADIDGGDPRQVAGLADSSEATKPIPLGRVDVAWISPTRAAVSWVVGRGAVADIVVRTVGLDGSLGERHVVATTSSSRASGFPRLVRQGDRLVVAWTEPEGDVSLHTAAIALPLE